MIHVLFVDHAEVLGGAEHSLLLLLKHLDRERFTPWLACNAGSLEQTARALGVAVQVVPMPRLRDLGAAPWRLWRGVGELAHLIGANGIDLVHSNAMRASFYAALAARRVGRPLLWHVRDIYRPGLYVRWMAHMATRAIAVSRAAAAPLPAGLAVEVVANGVDLAAFDAETGTTAAAAALRAAWGVPAEAPLVGLVGRLYAWKGQRDFIRAMALVRARCPQAWFVLIGGAIFGGGEAYEAELHALAAESGLGERLVFAGQRQDLPVALRALDVLVHCSTEPEPFGRVLIEGMAACLPVVAYDYGGASEVVVPEATGCLVPAGDRQALGEAVVALLEQPERAEALGAAGRRRVEAQYDIRDLTRRIESVFEQCVAGE